MENRKSISVWLILQDGENKGKVVLQKRNNKNKSFPYICQGTWAGKVEDRESLENAIKRECKEELGTDFLKRYIFSELFPFAKSNFKINGVKWVCFHYIGKTNQSLLLRARIHKEAFKKFVFIDEDSLTYQIKSGKNPKNNIVFFDDQYKIVKKLLRNGVKRNNK